MIMNLANILKIAYAASKVAETSGYLASGGKANQLSNIAGTVGQVVGAASTVAGATGAGGTADAAKAGPTPTTEFKPDLTGMSKADAASLTKASQQQAAWLGQQSPQAGALKVNPGGYTANQPKLQEAYLDGLKQSGAKLNKAGQIVKPDGQAFKKAGWDIQARGRSLEGVDASRRKDLITEARGYINKANALKTKAVDTRKAVSPKTPTKPTSTEMKVQPKSDETVHYSKKDKEFHEKLVEQLGIFTPTGDKLTIYGTDPKGRKKSAEEIAEEFKKRDEPLW